MNLNVSIIIINYNGKDLLKNCLSSLFKFTKDITFEIILIDNNSSESLDDLLKEFHNIKFIKNEKNLGFAAANNQGIKLSKGKYILFLNNDTVFFENTIKKIFDFVESIDRPVFVGCQLLNSDNSHQESVVEFPNIWNTFTENFFLYKMFPKSKVFNKYYQNFQIHENPIEVDVIKGAFMFCDADAVKNLNGFDERFFFYSEETDLCYRFKKIHGGKVILFPSCKIYHYGGTKDNEYNWFRIKNLSVGKIQFYQKHFHHVKFFIIVFIHYVGIFVRVIYNIMLGIILVSKTKIRKGFYFFKSLFIYPKNNF